MLEQILEQHYVLVPQTLSALNDVNNAIPTDGQVLTWDNSLIGQPATASYGGGTFVLQVILVHTHLILQQKH